MNKYQAIYKIIPLFFFLLASSCIKDEAENNGDFSLQAGNYLPAFSITNGDGQLSTNNLTGKVSLIVFFNTTCKDCQRAFPAIQEIYWEYKDHLGFKMILIAREQTEAEVNTYFTEHSYSMPFFTDKDRKVYALFADNTIPRFFLSGKDKKIIMTQATTLDKRKLTKQIDLLINISDLRR